MTEKSLSEKICEECGIKKKRVELYNCKGCKYLINNECERGDNPCKPPYKYVYPDFENNNNNFVKLLEIVSKKASVSFCHNGTYYGCSIHYFFKDIFEAVEGTLQHSFLNTLLVQDLRNPCKPKLLEQIKQAIRKAKWEV